MSLRDALVGGLLLVGVLLTAQGAVSTPIVTVQECSGSGSVDAETPSATPECVRYTERAWGQQLYVVGLGVGVIALGAVVVVADRLLTR